MGTKVFVIYKHQRLQSQKLRHGSSSSGATKEHQPPVRPPYHSQSLPAIGSTSETPLLTGTGVSPLQLL